LKTTGIFTTHYFKIPVKKSDEVYYLIPFGDVHRSSPLCHVEKWKEFLEWAQKKERSYFLGMGDLDDLISSKERVVFHNRTIHDSTIDTFDIMYKEYTERLAKELEFMRGKLIGMIEGNHFAVLKNGMTTTQYLCQLLDCKYLGCSSFIRLVFPYGGNGGTKVDVWAHHGLGAARLVGGSLNKVQQMAEAAHADIYCVSDDTEILSIDGWKKIGDIKKNDEVFSFNLETSKIEKDVAISVLISDYNDKMYQFKNENVDMLISKNHRVVYKIKNGWLIKRANEFVNYTVQAKIPLAGKFNDGEVLLSDSEIALAGWIISEGSFLCSGIRITQKNNDKFDLIKSCVDNCGYRYTTQKRIDDINILYIIADEKNKIINYVYDKTIPEWVKFCSIHQFEIFLNAMMLGDGSWCTENSGTYYSSNEKLIDDFQAALCIHGYRTIKKWKNSGFKNGCWCLSICKRDTVNFAFSRKELRPIELEYNKKIWCINTKNTTMICRRNGYTFITGNCMGHDHKKSVGTSSRLMLSGCGEKIKLKHKKQLYVRTGSFLKGYEPEQISYVADMALNPADLGVVKIEMTPKKKQSGFSVDLHASI
jgi:hypothetical protein